jgi:putative membrane protein
LPFLHAGHAVTWGAWHLEPSVLGGVLIVLGLYGYALTLEEQPFRWWRPLVFVVGVLLMAMALVSPLDAGADRLLSLHMLQHVLLTTVGPPLVLLGLPQTALRRLFNHALLGRPLQAVTMPVVAALVFSVNMWLWHVPPVYGAALTHLAVHIAMHVAFMVSGFIFWWPVIQPLPERRISDGARLLFLVVTGFPMGILALLMISSANVIYGYYATPPHLWGISPIADQQVAGLIMGALGEAASFIAVSLIFLRFIDREEPPEPSFSRESVDPAG